MKYLLFVLAVVGFVVATFALLLSTSAVGQILGACCFVFSAVCLSGAGIVEAINRLEKQVMSTRPGADLKG